MGNTPSQANKKQDYTAALMQELTTAYATEKGITAATFPVEANITELSPITSKGRVVGARQKSLKLADYTTNKHTKGMVIRVVAYTFEHVFLYLKTAKETTYSALFEWSADTTDEVNFRMLQLVQPESWHDDVYVFGNTKGLESLGKACIKAVKTGLTQTFSAAPPDFETANINVVPLSINTAEAGLPSAYGQNPYGVMHLYSKEQGTLAYKTSCNRLLPEEMLEWVCYREAVLKNQTAQ